MNLVMTEEERAGDDGVGGDWEGAMKFTTDRSQKTYYEPRLGKHVLYILLYQGTAPYGINYSLHVACV